MIVKEPYISSTASTPLIKIYSDKNFLIQSKGISYKEAIIKNEEEINNFIEIPIGVPSPLADENFLYEIFIGEKQNITQQQVKEAKTILLKALRTLSDEEAYKVKILFEDWDYQKEYETGDRVLYNGELYNVLQSVHNTVNPADEKRFYQKIIKPNDLVEEWNNNGYNVGDKARIGQYIYESLIDNNTWSPQAFPAGWKLIQ